MTSVSLGMPSAPPPVLAPRRKTRQIKVGSVGVGSDSPISVQSMTTTPPRTSTPPCSRSPS
ncbi:4-hydroxy-3-methylbut-2-en-1-yl diphosphate synthase [Arthrobacter sp. Hiyo8]|nr:4-hydroxy-3-methylbut-2-en-1-yl diphosphate synthase [Arthrobacter sp. Hiyo8]